MIQGHGPSHPRAIFIADCPEKADRDSNQALSGYAGQTLSQFCKKNGFQWGDFFKTCLIKDQDFQLSSVKKKVKGWDWKTIGTLINPAGTQLSYEINQLEPYLLIPLGDISFHYLTGQYGLHKFRGSIMNSRGDIGLNKPYKVLPLLGPYPYLYQDERMTFITKNVDFPKIWKYLNDSPVPDNLIKPWVCSQSSQFRAFIDRCYPNAAFLVFDIETYCSIPTCISFSFDGKESCCIPILDSKYDRDNRMLMLGLVAKLLASPIPKVNQNIKYDVKILERWGFEIRNIVGDTLLAASTLYCEFPKNLGFLTSIYTDIPYFKNEGREFDPKIHSRSQYYLYCAKDSLSTHQIYTKQQDEIKELGVKFVYDNLIRLLPIYKRMENNGIRRDEERRLQLLAKYEGLFFIKSKQARILVNESELNCLSSAQANRIVFDVLEYKKTRGVTGTDEESLELLIAYSSPKKCSKEVGDRILQTFLDCRKIHKVIEILELEIWPDGRFRCEFNLAGTETGRSSGGKCTDGLLSLDKKGNVKKGKNGYLPKLGHSLQTIGKHGFIMDGREYGSDLRSVFVPSRGCIFVGCDLSGAEARVDAVLMERTDTLPLFDKPGIHKLTGSWIYGCKPEEIKKGSLEYHMAKTVRHAGERNMMADRMMAMTQRPLRECEAILKRFHEFQPEIKSIFHREVIDAIKNERSLRMPNGRRRDFFGKIDHHTFNEGISTIPQAIVSDQTKFEGIKKTFEGPCGEWARLLCEEHDGSLAEVPKGREEEYGQVYKNNVERSIDFRNGSLPREFDLIIPCEVATGENWAELERIEI